MQDSPKAALICIWCNRVMAWGKPEIWYDVCEACAPQAASEVEQLLARRAEHRSWWRRARRSTLLTVR